MKMDNNQFNEFSDIVSSQLSYYESEWDRLSSNIEGRDEVYYEFVSTMMYDYRTLLELVDAAVHVNDEDKQ